MEVPKFEFWIARMASYTTRESCHHHSGSDDIVSLRLFLEKTSIMGNLHISFVNLNVDQHINHSIGNFFLFIQNHLPIGLLIQRLNNTMNDK